MKNLRLVVAWLIFVLPTCMHLYAQPEYRREHLATPGNNFLIGSIDIQRDTMRLDSVSNAVLDFSQYQLQQVDTIFFHHPGAYESKGRFMKPDLAMERNRKFTRMLRWEKDTLWQVGYIGDYLDINANVVLPFIQHTKMLVFPVKLGASYKQTIHRDIKAPYFFREGIDSIRKIYDIRRKSKVLGEGNIKTAYGNYSGVLQKTVLKRECKGYTFSSFGWTPKRQMSCDERKVIYRWFDPEHGYPVATVVLNNRGYVTRMDYLLELPLKLNARSRDITCHGGSDGGILVKANGGAPPYRFSWSNDSTGRFIRNLQAGTYEVTVTDNQGQPIDTSITLNQPPKPFTVDIQARNESCYNALDGRLIANISNGKPPYKLKWSNGGTKDTMRKVRPGKYHITVTDQKGCKARDTAVVKGARAPLRVQLFASDSKCKGEPEGRIKSRVSGGVAPYNYQWNNGDTTASLKGIMAGTYELRVTDAHGCSKTESVLVGEPGEVLRVQVDKRDVTCNGFKDGKASVVINGGVPQYRIRWFNNSANKTVRGLSTGHYSVHVFDRAGCHKQEHFSIKEPKPLQVDFDLIRPYANRRNGTVQTCIEGGTPPYEVEWGNGQTGQRMSHAAEGTYRVRITDSYNCRLEEQVQLPQQRPYRLRMADLDRLMWKGTYGQTMVRLTNMYGEQIKDFRPFAGFYPLQVNHLEDGLYFIELWKPGSGIVFKGRLIKGGNAR